MNGETGNGKQLKFIKLLNDQRAALCEDMKEILALERREYERKLENALRKGGCPCPFGEEQRDCVNLLHGVFVDVGDGDASKGIRTFRETFNFMRKQMFRSAWVGMAIMGALVTLAAASVWDGCSRVIGAVGRFLGGN